MPVFGQVDSPESLETPEITEIIENLIKVAKDFTKLKDTLTNYAWGKISLQTTARMKLSVVSGFSNMLYCIKGKPGNAGNRQKAF